MQVEQQVVTGGTRCQCPCGTHHYLVIAVEEVYLEALDTHVGIVFEVGLGVLDGIAPRRPQNDAYALLLAVG